MAINSRNGNTLLESGFFPPVRAATTAAIVLSGLQTVDGVALAEGDRVLVKDQADATTNGLYAASSGAWVRTSDAAGNTDFFNGMAVLVAPGGTVNGAIIFVCTCADDPVVVGTSEITFESQSDVQTAMQTATSTTSLALATGAMNFVTQAGKDFAAKQYVLAYSAANPDNAALCKIGSYSGTALATTCVSIGGSGTVNDWVIVLVNSPAAAGRVPPLGTGNVTGPGSSVAGRIAVFADATGKVLDEAAVAPGTLAGRDQVLAGDVGTLAIGPGTIQDGAAPLPFIAPQPSDNLILSNDAGNPTRDVDISPGRVRDDAELTNLRLIATMVKRLDQAWAPGGKAGAPVGACDSGTKGASQTWHFYLIAKLGLAITQYSRTSNVATITAAGHGLGVGGTARTAGIGGAFDGVVPITAVTTNTLSYASTGAAFIATAVSATLDGFDVLASNQASNAYPTPAMPSGWTAKQCLGSVLTDGSGNIRPFQQFGDYFSFNTPLLDYNDLALSVGDTTLTLTVPLGVAVEAAFNIRTGGTSGAALYFRHPSSTSLSSSDNAAPLGQFNALAGAIKHGFIRCWTDANGHVVVNEDVGAPELWVSVLGWRDPRRRLF